MSESPHPNNFYSDKVGKHVVTADNLDNTVNHLNNTINETRPPTKGGTGLNTYTQGDILYSDADNSLAKLPKSTNNINNEFLKGGDSPSWVNLLQSDIGGLRNSDDVVFNSITGSTNWKGDRIRVKYGGTNNDLVIVDSGGYNKEQGSIIIINDTDNYNSNDPGDNLRYTSIKLTKGQFLVGSVEHIYESGKPNIVSMNGDATMDENALVTVNSSTALEKKMDSNSHIENGDDVNEGRIICTLIRYYSTHGTTPITLGTESNSYFENYFIYNVSTTINSGADDEFIYVKYLVPLSGEKNGKRLTIRSITFNGSGQTGINSTNSQIRILEVVTINSNNVISVNTSRDINIPFAGTLSNSSNKVDINYIDTDNPKGIRIDTSGSANGIIIQILSPFIKNSTYSIRAIRLTPPTVIYNYT